MLKEFKSKLFSAFTNKWTQHQHNVPHCNSAVVFDGNWKTARAKCCFDCVDYPSKVLGNIPIGCTQTPNRRSFYCEQHKSHSLSFTVGDTIKMIKPNDIKHKALCM